MAAGDGISKMVCSTQKCIRYNFLLVPNAYQKYLTVPKEGEVMIWVQWWPIQGGNWNNETFTSDNRFVEWLIAHQHEIVTLCIERY